MHRAGLMRQPSVMSHNLYKTLLLCISYVALLCGCAAAPVAAPIPLLLTFSDGTCSGTAIAPHAILTATHCFGGQTVKLAGLTVKQRVDDGDDHTILIVTQTFRAHADVAPMPDLGKSVHILGNPGGLRQIYASGTVAGNYDGDTLLNLPIYYGDSGAAVLDDAGHVVGVISGIRVLAGGGAIEEWAETKPFRFTGAQWKRALR